MFMMDLVSRRAPVVDGAGRGRFEARDGEATGALPGRLIREARERRVAA
jgi:N-acyl-D-aspartate/D-glutamate deacylase